MRKLTLVIIINCLLLLSTSSWAVSNRTNTSWSAWVKELRQEAIDDGISASLFDDLFHNLSPDKKTVNLDRRQPETRLTFNKYRKTRGDAYRINLGKKKYKKYQTLLDEVGGAYGVDPCFITALWGIESSYGHFMGSFPVIKSLATLAYDDRRSAFFRKELLLALHILDGGHVSLSKFKGEWAGGSGMPQFLPSSWHKFAVDYDNDGRKDIWSSHADAFASIANYLVGNGWQTNEPWGVEVNVPYGIDSSLIGYDNEMPLQEWIARGVRPARGFEFPNRNLSASLIQPYGGPSFLVFNNFKVLLRYNNSIFYAGTVAHIADKICRR